MKIKIIGDTKKAQEILETNIPLREGQVISVGQERKMKMLAQKYPEVFERVTEKSADEKIVSSNKSYPWYKTK